MKLETKLKRLAARLPAKQQALDFFGESLWQEFPHDAQQACRRSIADLLLQVLQAEFQNETINSTEEDDDHE